ncbi:hypothetical protein [Maribacter sp.]|uniref:hypothetical protein n=1 Tax=Maribacter sp. TaxID=1897614 RepID=UPI0025BE37B4|nr:hypothetical protein [Maribacter sp.]
MSKKFIPIFFTAIFFLFLTAPIVITLANDYADISSFYSVSEEETGDEVKVVLHLDCFFQTDILFTKKVTYLGYYSKKYPILHLNLISPPPDLHIL